MRALLTEPQRERWRRLGGRQNVDPGTELDKAHALAALHGLAFAAAANDAPSQKSRDLFESDFKTQVLALAAQRDHALFVALGRGRVHGVQELTVQVLDLDDCSGDRCAVHVHIEDAQENADALARAFRSIDGYGFGDQAVTRRHNQTFAGGDGALGIAEKPEEECRQQNRGHAPGPAACKPRERCSHRQKAERVNVTVANHCPQRLYGASGQGRGQAKRRRGTHPMT
jgi:hypothetical protein